MASGLQSVTSSSASHQAGSTQMAFHWCERYSRYDLGGDLVSEHFDSQNCHGLAARIAMGALLAGFRDSTDRHSTLGTPEYWCSIAGAHHHLRETHLATLGND
jgi:hypothetical protein